MLLSRIASPRLLSRDSGPRLKPGVSSQTQLSELRGAGLDDGEVGAAEPAFYVGVQADFIPCGLALDVGLFSHYLKDCALA